MAPMARGLRGEDTALRREGGFESKSAVGGGGGGGVDQIARQRGMSWARFERKAELAPTLL